jgi:hypothetical protein
VAMGAGRNSQKKRTVGKAVKPEAGYRGCAVPPPDQHHLVFPAPFRKHSPKPLSAGSAQPGAPLFLTAELRRVIFLCVTLRLSALNAITAEQSVLDIPVVSYYSGHCVSTPAGRFGDPRSTSCTGLCHMKICLGQRSSYRKYEARCGWSGGYSGNAS